MDPDYKGPAYDAVVRIPGDGRIHYGTGMVDEAAELDSTWRRERRVFTFGCCYSSTTKVKWNCPCAGCEECCVNQSRPTGMTLKLSRQNP